VLVEKVIVHPPTGKWSGRGLDPERVEIIWRVHANEQPSQDPRASAKVKKKKGS
jgi:hypothetical protein